MRYDTTVYLFDGEVELASIFGTGLIFGAQVINSTTIIGPWKAHSFYKFSAVQNNNIARNKVDLLSILNKADNIWFIQLEPCLKQLSTMINDA
jgi:hypothetical protein